MPDMLPLIIEALLLALFFAVIMGATTHISKKLEWKTRLRGRIDEFEALGVEKIDVSSLKPCPYCGLPLIVEHLREPWLEEPDFYYVEHEDLKAAAKKDCPALYASFGSVEKAVEMMNRRA